MSNSVRHSRQTIAQGIHSPVSFVYPDEAARLAATGFIVEDGYKLALQLDDESLWLLLDLSPTWIPVGGGGGVSDHDALVGLDNDDHPQYYNQGRLDTVVDGYQPTFDLQSVLNRVEDLEARTGWRYIILALDSGENLLPSGDKGNKELPSDGYIIAYTLQSTEQVSGIIRVRINGSTVFDAELVAESFISVDLLEIPFLFEDIINFELLAGGNMKNATLSIVWVRSV